MIAWKPTMAGLTRSLLLVAICWLPAGEGKESAKKETAPARMNVPVEHLLTDARKYIRSIFKKEYADVSSDGKRSLAGKLIEQSRDGNNPPAQRYVLLDEAVVLALGSGDLRGVRMALDQLTLLFNVNVAERRLQALLQLTRYIKTERVWLRWIAECRKAAAEAVAADDFRTALRAINEAWRYGYRLSDKELKASLEAERSAYQALQRDYFKVQTAMKTLKDKPDDPVANTVAGEYFTLGKGDFATGLPFLLKSGKAPYKDAATADVANPETPEARVQAGHCWWRVAEAAESERHQKHAKLRALYWYKPIVDKLIGLPMVQVKRRIDSIPPEWLVSAAGKQGGNNKNPPLPPDSFTQGDRHKLFNLIQEKKYEDLRTFLDEKPGIANMHSHPLTHVVNRGEVAAARILLEYGASIDRADTRFHMTALNWAIKFGKVEMVKLLLEFDPDPTHTIGPKGATYVRQARGSSKPEILELLKKHGMEE